MNKEQIESIIKYDTRCQYFGKWTPAQVHSIIEALRKGEQTSKTIVTGKITLKDICATLWNEMSYNPVRFGTENPFIINGMLDIDNCANRYKQKNNPNYSFMCSLKTKLKDCIESLKEYDPRFQITDTTQSDTMYVDMKNEYSSITNIEYKILSSLMKCIHLICSINCQDFKNSSEHRNIITLIALERHPNLLRSLNRTMFVTIPDDTKTASQKKIEELQKKETSLNKAHFNIIGEIAHIEGQISNLQELDTPGDTQVLNAELKKAQQKLSQIEQALTYNQMQQQNLK